MERFQLPAPIFEAPPGCIWAVLFGRKPLAAMDRAERVRACYLHACLKHVNRGFPTNASLRKRFDINAATSASAASMVSRYIRETVEAGYIKQKPTPPSVHADPSPASAASASAPPALPLRSPQIVERRDSIALVLQASTRLAVVHPADFANAHLRHWEDAESLFRAGRWANADQLYGLSAECGLKAVMVANGLRVKADKSPRDEYRKHINDNTLWGGFRAFVQGRQTGQLLHHLPQSNPFASWRIANRYANGVHFNKQSVDPHRAAARRVRDFYYLQLKVNGHV